MGGKPIDSAGKGTLGECADIGEFIEVSNYFEGTLDGKNNTIANLNINQKDMNGVGLIGVLEANGEARCIAGGIVGM